MTIRLMENLKEPCKDDCIFCGTEVFQGKNSLFKKSCYGPPEMKLIRDFPQNNKCKKITQEVLTIQDALMRSFESKLCVCDTDGCNTDPDNNTPSEEMEETDDPDDDAEDPIPWRYDGGANSPTILNQLLVVSSLSSIVFYN